MEPLTEGDLALINALQLQPRAEWGELAAALDVTPATVARRWQSLRGRGLAWIAVTVGYPRDYNRGTALALVSCRADATARVAEQLVREGAIATASTTMGRSHFLLDLFLPDIDRLRRYLGTRLHAIDGVTDVCSLLVTRVYIEGGSWRLRALDADQTRQLHRSAARRDGRRRAPVDDVDRALIAALTQDGRLSWAQLGARCGTSAPTARRRIERLLSAGEITLRCEMATPLVGPAVHVTFLAHLPAGELDAAGGLLAAMPQCRFAAATAGPHNLVTTVWLAGVSDIVPFEEALARQLPGLVVDDRIVHLGTIKRVGHVLDQDSRTTEVVPLVAW